MPVYLCVSVVCAIVAQFFGGLFCFLFGLVFVEVGFDSPAKLAASVPPFKCEPTLLALHFLRLEWH